MIVSMFSICMVAKSFIGNQTMILQQNFTRNFISCPNLLCLVWNELLVLLFLEHLHSPKNFVSCYIMLPTLKDWLEPEPTNCVSQTALWMRSTEKELTTLHGTNRYLYISMERLMCAFNIAAASVFSITAKGYLVSISEVQEELWEYT